jgi:hypothetical protein
MAINVVELIADQDECAFDQPCRFGHRVEGHAVYCQNDAWTDGPRKCRRTWYSGGEFKDEDCPGFQPNPAFRGEMSPTPMLGDLCSACGGTKLRKAPKNVLETCERCCGDGVEPSAMDLSQYEQDTLELGLGSSYQPGAQRDLYMRGAKDNSERESLGRLEEAHLVSVRTIASFGGELVLLLRLTGKGDAVMRANWKRNKRA